MLLPITSKVNKNNHLEISGIDFSSLVSKYGTPLYVYDIKTIKHQCREYVSNFNFEGIQSTIIYASKAFNCIAMCQLVKKEGLSIDVSTGGELFIALESGFDPEKIYFHGNNKSEGEIQYGIKNKVGCFIVDNFEELENLQKTAKEYGIIQNILLRITPGIHASTHEYIQTGKEKSKFGFGLTGGVALEAVKKVLSMKNLKLKGIHSHIGSQIFNSEPYEKLIGVQLKFLAEVKKHTGVELDWINIGGGLGVKYLESDNPASIAELAKTVKNAIKTYSEKYNVKIKKLMLEPGRSIAGNAGISIYKVGVVKEIPQIHNYIAVDGGMSDNIRPVLYGAVYTPFIANRMDDTKKVNDKKDWKKYSIVGKHCESGDILIENAFLPDINVGDFILLATAGAYCYSMSSNYNGQTKPAIVAVENGKDYLWVERESYKDLIKGHGELHE
ncbi:MAG: diaminopimelate decarboxylase [Actinobacteria bacterium]|nr:diaminopimelate decarboxylase [Actinomycetota bacterium]